MIREAVLFARGKLLSNKEHEQSLLSNPVLLAIRSLQGLVTCKFLNCYCNRILKDMRVIARKSVQRGCATRDRTFHTAGQGLAAAEEATAFWAGEDEEAQAEGGP